MASPVESSEAVISMRDAAVEYGVFVDGVGVFVDVGRGMVKASGVDVLDLLNRLSTNRVDNLRAGEGAPTIFTNEKGRIIDLVYVLNLGEFLLLLTGDGAQGQVMEWVDRYTFIEDSELEDVTGSMSMLSVAGRKASDVLESVTGTDLGGLGAYGSCGFESDGVKGWLVRMEVGQIPGFRVLVGDEDKQALLEMLFAQGVTSEGAEEWEAFRIGAGTPVYGKELDEGRNPLEAGLIGAINFTKGCYIGQEVIARLDTYEKVQRALVSLRVGGSWEEGDGLMLDGRRVGEVTSLARVSDDGDGVGLGYVRLSEATVGKRFVGVGSDGSWAEVVGVPKLFGE